MRYADIASRFMPLGAALGFLQVCGLSEAEAKSFLVAAVADKRVRVRAADGGPFSLSGLAREPEATDWAESRARDYVIPSGRKVLTRIKLDRGDVEALCELVRTEAGAADPPSRGRKPHGATRDTEILQEIGRMLEAGEISDERGSRTAVAKALHKKFPDYEVDTIARKITEQRKKPAGK